MTSEEAEYHIGCLVSLKDAQEVFISRLKCRVASLEELNKSLYDLNKTSDELIAAFESQRNLLIKFIFKISSDLTEMNVLPAGYQRVLETMMLEIQMMELSGPGSQ